MADNIITPEFRVSFPQVFTAKKAPGAEKEKFSMSMLFPKGTDLSKLKAAAQAAAKEKWGDKLPAKMKSPFLKAEDYEYEGYEEGMVLIRATSINRPGLVDAALKPILNEADFYPGCYARAEVRAFAYDQNGNKGVAFGLQNIQKVRDGESLNGRKKAEDVFEAVAGEGGVAEGQDGESLFG